MTFHMLAYLHKWPWPRWPCRWRWQSWKSWRGQWAVVRETSWLWAASLKPENMWSWGGWTSNQLSINSGMTASEIQALLFINMNRPQKRQNQPETTNEFLKNEGIVTSDGVTAAAVQLCTQVTAPRPMVAKDGSTGTTGHQLENSDWNEQHTL